MFKDSDGMISMMRVCVFIATVAISFPLICSGIYLIIYGTDLGGVAAIIGAGGAAYTGVLFAKSQQAKYELQADQKPET